MQERQFYLFSDMLIWAKPTSKDKYEFKGLIPAKLLYYTDLPDTDCLSSLSFPLFRPVCL